ncbi:hypothetical protein [Pyramidobacter piscolens]|uniref:hypothetical protein n=1 Tax=Pyramidobacter piscolens TaxID=638849 RepID=UPI001FCB9807|nr:hypothetical protein [Pyramidobacter piscolens]BDF78619.1 hypothetical protein CE91St28_14130 [Pyramidobacter piscolens]
MKIDDYKDVEVNNVDDGLIGVSMLFYCGSDPAMHEKPYARSVVEMTPEQACKLASKLLKAAVSVEIARDK